MQFLARSLAKLSKFSAGASLRVACREAKGCAEAGRRAGEENFSLTRTMRKTDSGSSKAPPTCARRLKACPHYSNFYTLPRAQRN